MKFFTRFNDIVKCLANAGLGSSMGKCLQGKYPYKNIRLLGNDIPVFLPASAWVFENYALEKWKKILPKDS